MKIYRFKNGDRCPCCGQELQGKTPEELAEFSIIVYSIGSQLGLADWILRPGPNAIVISTEDMEAAP